MILEASWIDAEKIDVGNDTVKLSASKISNPKMQYVVLSVETNDIRLGTQRGVDAITSAGTEAGSVKFTDGATVKITNYNDIKELKMIAETVDSAAVVHVNYYGSL